MPNQYPANRLLRVGEDDHVVTLLQERIICLLHSRASAGEPWQTEAAINRALGHKDAARRIDNLFRVGQAAARNRFFDAWFTLVKRQRRRYAFAFAVDALGIVPVSALPAIRAGVGNSRAKSQQKT